MDSRWRIPFGGFVPAGSEAEAVRNVVDSGMLSVGEVTERFEEKFATHIGTSRVITTNSGSSALLLAVAALCSPHNAKPLKPGDEVIICAECFPIDVAVLVQHGLRVKLVDVDLTTCLIDMDELEEAVSEQTKLIMAVHLCGNVIDLDRLYEICRRKGVPYVIEDCCDALGSKYDGKHVGVQATFACFSFYPAHHMTTGEGGAVTGTDDELLDIVLSIRNWGRVKQGVEYSDFGMRFRYDNWGYNMKWTDLSAALGLEQMKALNSFSATRRRNHEKFVDRLYEGKLAKNFIEIKSIEKADPCWMLIPLVLSENSTMDRNALVARLESMGVETRPLFVGNILKQPIGQASDLLAHGTLKNADYLFEKGFLVGNHHSMTINDMEYLYDCFEKILSG